jgi:NTE family protein
MTRALVMSGGGVKGAYQLGVLRKWLLEDRIEYDVYSGVSVGALNAAVLAQVPYGDPVASYNKLAAIWDDVDNSNIRKDWKFFGKLAALWKGHVYNSEPLQEWVQRDVDAEALRTSGKKLLVGATSLDTGEYKVAREDTPDIWKWVYSSAAFPLFFEEGLMDSNLWVDGGVRNVTPLSEVIRLGVDEIDVILAANPHQTRPWDPKGKAIWQKAFRILDIVMTEITLTDLHAVGLKNDLARLGAGYKPIKVRLIHPKEELVDDALDFDPEAIAEMREIGYREARAAEEIELKALLPS